VLQLRLQKKVLINLTTNAIKFTTTEDTRTIKVILSASRERPSASATPCVSYFPMRPKRTDQTFGQDWGEGEEIYIEFAVQDTGRGLSPEELKVLFQRFQQASPRTHVQYGGSGLGLFISRELTELQGGEIGVSSESGKGSTFAFYVKSRRSQEPSEAVEGATGVVLARKPSNARDKDRVVEAPKIKDFATVTEKASVNITPKIQRSDLRVLIVEDNLGRFIYPVSVDYFLIIVTLVNQKVLQRQLNNHGITTRVANHGGEALETLKSSTYWKTASSDAIDLGVVLMDKEMPVMDGLQCTSRIRELEKAGDFKCHIPIIAVTANARSEQIATLLAAGMDDVVSKPFRIAELIPKIEELAAKYPSIPSFKNEVSLVVPRTRAEASGST
jgi:CheY-like chemotaxis protein